MAKQIDAHKTAKREMAQRLYVDSNYTQEEVAAIIGVTRQTIVRWAKEHQSLSDGQRQPKQTHLTSSLQPSPSSKKT